MYPLSQGPGPRQTAELLAENDKLRKALERIARREPNAVKIANDALGRG